MNIEIADRLNTLRSCYIPHKTIRSAITGIERAITLSKDANEPSSCLLIGPSGTGKSTTCDAILHKRQSSIAIKDGCETTIVPAFYTEIPSPVSVYTLTSSMLAALGDPAPTEGNPNALVFRLSTLLKQCGIEVIILDELHNLLSADPKRLKEVTQWLKSLINEHNVPIIAAGTPECISIINSDKQIARRFLYHFKLFNLRYGAKKKGEFRKFIEGLSNAYITTVKMADMPDFRSKQLSLSAYIATGGNPSDTSNLFREAVALALEDNRDQVKTSDFYDAFDSLALPHALSKIKNPFDLSITQLNLLFNKTEKKAA